LLGLAVDPWADLPARDSVGWNARTRPSSTELSLPSPSSLGSPYAGMMAAGNDDYCKRIRNMGTSNNTRFQPFLSWLTARLHRSFRGESPIGDRFDAWPASARSFSPFPPYSTRLPTPP